MANAGTTDLSHENRRLEELGPALALKAQVVGGGALALAVIAGLILGFTGSAGFEAGLSQFFRSYILAIGYVSSIALGALIFVLLQHLTRAGWSVTVRRLAEVVCAAIPWLGILALPVLIPVWLGMEDVYPWTDIDAWDDQTGLLVQKAGYLNPTFFTIRMVLYFAIWSWLARYFYVRSVEQDNTGAELLTTEMQRLSAPGTLLFAITATFFAFDLLMSLTPHWFSTIFGVYFFAGGMVGFFSVLTLMMVYVQRNGRLASAINTEHYHDVGKFLFAFVVFWAYIAFSQYMLIWYANIPEETYWYQARQSTGWWIFVSLLLLFGHFVIPFLALISRFPKRHPKLLVFGALWMLVAHFVDLYYIVAPDANGWLQTGGAGPLHSGLLHLVTDIPAVIGIAGIYLSFVVKFAANHSLVPLRDPRLNEALAFHNF